MVSGAYGGSTEEQKQERRQLAEDLLDFVEDAFGEDTFEEGASEADESGEGFLSSAPATENSGTGISTQQPAAEADNLPKSTGDNPVFVLIVAGFVLFGVAAGIFLYGCRRKN